MSKKSKHMDPTIEACDRELEDIRSLHEQGLRLYFDMEKMGADESELERLRAINTHFYMLELTTKLVREMRVAQLTLERFQSK